MEIEIKNLCFSYNKDGKPALDNVNLNIHEGDYFGIVGKTGSGKSTLIQHLNGLIKLEKEKGSIKIGDFDLSDKKCDFVKLRSKIGMVFQYPEYQLFADTVFSDVAFGLKNFCPGLDENIVGEKVRYALELVGFDYEKIKDKSPFELSGGQKRRVAIAGVIVSSPEILVLDEPAAGLDPKGKREFLELLRKLKQNTVKTIIIVSHDMDLIAENCNKVAVFKDGKVVLEGTPKQVFENESVLDDCGLELPLTAYITKKLKEKGIEFDCDLTVNDFITSALKMKKGGSDR